ncbi:hypothetical protein [Hymenobacter rubripertinctus]|uniref:Uncharacterized protein n=1 Tax=Hymenobacter rubripertinctus TaxID=2029981 RepID=A0A418R6X3_9BACT|nr:hypothetical protein [Hymenobacter rubripertinctus]RIY13268.1 hypothetical protein D0T11_02200 [Hymenobacter rubripertinctus]
MIDYTILITRADCDTATAELDFELKTFSTRDATLDLADERGDRAQASASAQLASLDGRIAAAENLLAATGIAAELREATTDDLALLRAQRTKLDKRTRQQGGVRRFLAAVDAQQVADQVATLTAARAGVAAHRATLPA